MFYRITTLCCLLAILGVLAFQNVFTDDSVTSTTSTENPVGDAPYCRTDKNGQKQCYCLSYKLFETPEGIKQLETMYDTDVNSVYDKFPYFHSEIGAALTQGSRSKFLYYAPPTSGKNTELQQNVFTYDVDSINSNSLDVCKLTIQKTRDFNGGNSGKYDVNDNPYYWTWLWDQALYYQGDIKRTRPIIIYDESSKATLYSMSGYNYYDDVWVKDMRKQVAGQRIVVPFYDKMGSLLTVVNTIVHTKTIQGGGDEGNREVVDYVEYVYGYTNPTGLANIIGVANIEEAMLVGNEYLYIFLSENDKLSYQVFKRYTKKPPTPKVTSLKPENLLNKSCDSEGCARYATEGNTVSTVATVQDLPASFYGEYFLPISKKESLNISSRHSFDIQVLSSDLKRETGDLEKLPDAKKDETGDYLSTVTGKMILSGGSTKSRWDTISDENYNQEKLFQDVYFLDFTRDSLKDSKKKYLLPEAQKLVKLIRKSDNSYFYLIGGNLENHYYYIDLRDGDSIDFDKLADTKNWVKVIFDMDDEIQESDQTEYSTTQGIPAMLNLFEEGNNVSYQQYGAIPDLRYPKQMSFITSNQQIQWLPTRVCRKRFKVYPCGHTWLRIVGSTQFPIDIEQVQQSEISYPTSNNKTFRSGKMDISLSPITSLTKDNQLSFSGNIQINAGAASNPIEELRVHSVYFVEDDSTRAKDEPPVIDADGEDYNFTGFSADFFTKFFRIKSVNPQASAGKYSYEGTDYDQSLVNYNGSNYKALYKENTSYAFESKTRNCGLSSGNSVCDHAQFSQFVPRLALPDRNHAVMYSGEENKAQVTPIDLQTLSQASFLWSKKFTPGQHRVHMLVTATHSRQLLEYKVRSNLWRGYQGSRLQSILGPHVRTPSPSDMGLNNAYIGAFGPMKVYYQAFIIDFYVPEITSFDTKTSIEPFTKSHIQSLSLTAPAIAALFKQDGETYTFATSLENIYKTGAWKALSEEQQNKILHLWDQAQKPVPIQISSIRPMFELEKGLTYNLVDFFSGENVDTKASALTGNEAASKLSPNDSLFLGKTMRLNDLPLNLPVFASNQLSFDGGSYNIQQENLHTVKAHLVRTNRDGQAMYASQQRFYPLENLSAEQKTALQAEGMPTEFYKVFSLVTDENGNQMGTKSVLLQVKNEAKIHIYSLHENLLFAAWAPYQPIKLVQNGKEYFLRADKDGNFSFRFSESGVVTFFKQTTTGDFEEIKDEKGVAILLNPQLPAENSIPKISNYVSGDVIFSKQPVFEGVAKPSTKVFYRMYFRNPRPTGLPIGYFEEQGERTLKILEYGETESDEKGNFVFFPEKNIYHAQNKNGLYYIEVGADETGRDEGLWKKTNVISVRYQKQVSFEDFPSSLTLLAGTKANKEPSLAYDALGQKYVFGLFDGTAEKYSSVLFTTPAHVKLRFGQIVALPPQGQMLIASEKEGGYSFKLVHGSEVVHADTLVAQDITQTGVFSSLEGETLNGLKKSDLVVAPKDGGKYILLDEDVELILPAYSRILSSEVKASFPDSMYQVDLFIKGKTEDFSASYPSFDFAKTRFDFADFQSVFQSECGVTEKLNPANIKKGSVEQCRLISEMIFPQSQDPQLFFPHNGSILDEAKKIELLGVSWPNTVLQIIIGGEHVGTVTTDKKGRFSFEAPQIFDFQKAGTERYQSMQKNGVSLELYTLESAASPLSLLLSFAPNGESIETSENLFAVKTKFLEKISLIDATLDDGYDAISLIQTFFERLKHLMTINNK